MSADNGSVTSFGTKAPHVDDSVGTESAYGFCAFFVCDGCVERDEICNLIFMYW